jgi:hypothetical protein
MLEQVSLRISDKVPPPLALLQLAMGYWVSQAIYVAAKLGIADSLKDGPKSCADLARATGAHPDSLDRLLRALASVGVFAPEKDNRFGLTPIGECLQSKTVGSMRAMVLTLGQEHYQAWAHLLHSIRTGEPAFDHVFKMGLFQYLAQNPASGQIFDEAMAGVTALVSFAIVAAYDFSAISTVVDVGGGHGELIKTILMVNRNVKAILFDSPPAIEEANRRINGDGLAKRYEVTAGDFFQSVPRGGDAYVLKNILHDWNDADCITILKNCHSAMAEHGKVLLVETVKTANGEPFDSLLDLNMLVISRGRERSEAEYRALLDAAGLKLTKVIPTMSPLSVIEAVRQ